MEREKNENTIRMIQELTDAAGASGFEDEVILTAKKYGEEFAQKNYEEFIQEEVKKLAD